MNEQNKANLVLILAALYFQLQPINRALDSIGRATSKGDPVWYPDEWTTALADARVSLENIQDTITSIIAANKKAAGFDPEQWN